MPRTGIAVDKRLVVEDSRGLRAIAGISVSDVYPAAMTTSDGNVLTLVRVEPSYVLYRLDAKMEPVPSLL